MDFGMRFKFLLCSFAREGEWFNLFAPPRETSSSEPLKLGYPSSSEVRLPRSLQSRLFPPGIPPMRYLRAYCLQNDRGRSAAGPWNLKEVALPAPAPRTNNRPISLSPTPVIAAPLQRSQLRKFPAAYFTSKSCRLFGHFS